MATGMEPSSHCWLLLLLLLQPLPALLLPLLLLLVTALRLRLSAGQVQWLLYFHFFPLVYFPLFFFCLLQLAFHLRSVARLESLSILWRRFALPAHPPSYTHSYSCIQLHALLRSLCMRLVLNCWVTWRGQKLRFNDIFWSNASHTHIDIQTCTYVHVYVCM